MSSRWGLVCAGVLMLVASACKGDEPPRSTGDPSPKPDIRAEAARFAPAVWLADSEKNMPMDASRFVAESQLLFDYSCTNGRPEELVAKDVDESRLGGKGEGPYVAKDCEDKGQAFASDKETPSRAGGDFYLDPANTDQVRNGDGPSAPAYWEHYDSGEGQTAYVYWLFYSYNDFINNHEGDWERVAVRLDDGKPRGLTFWKHNEGPCNVDWDDAEKIDGHPVAYAAKGSHGSYHRAGMYATTTSVPDIIDHTSPGTQWSTWTTVRPVVDQPWWHYRGLWGSQDGIDGMSNGPRGPYPGRSEAVFPEKDCLGPLTPTATPGPPVPTQQQADAVPPAFLGTWHSPKPADQPTSAKTYYVELTIRAGAVDTRVGDVRYPGLDCSGSLTLIQAAPERLVVAEHIDKLPKDPCTIDGFITLTPTATGLHLEYVRRDERNTITMRAELIH